MSVINSFLKKRIDQMVKECDSPLDVFEQLKEVMDFESDEDAKELMDYLISVWMETPRENLLGNSPRDFMEKSIAREMGVELDEDEETLMEELANMADEDFMYAFERASEILDNKNEYSKKKISKNKYDLSLFHNEIANFPLTQDLQKFLKHMSGDGDGRIQIDESGFPKSEENKKTMKKPETNDMYINFLNDISFMAQLTEKKKKKGKKGKKAKKITLTAKGHQFISGENLDELFPKLLIKWINYKDPLVIFSKEIGSFKFDYSHQGIRPVYSLLQIGKEWINVEDAFIPMMALGNNDVGIVLEEHGGGEKGLRELQRISHEFDDTEIRHFQKFGIIQRREVEGSCDEIKLTELGHYLLDLIFNRYHILCRLNAKLMFAKITSDYFDFMLFDGMRLGSELEDDEIYDNFCNLCMEHETILVGFIRGFEILEEDSEEAKGFEEIIDEYIHGLDKNMKELKKRFDYDNRRMKMLNSNDAF